MRTLNLFVFTLVLGAAAFGQNYQNYHSVAPAPSMESTVQIQDHPQYIIERSLFASSSVTIAHGERPAYEVLSLPPSRPLGDVARDYRREHAMVKKARIVWEP